jgi:hypothetical protein
LKHIFIGLFRLQVKYTKIISNSQTPYSIKKIEKGVYQVYFEQDLSVGEYCFMYAGSMSVNGVANPKVYDFGVQ